MTITVVSCVDHMTVLGDHSGSHMVGRGGHMTCGRRRVVVVKMVGRGRRTRQLSVG
jgi:hypothetical protein